MPGASFSISSTDSRMSDAPDNPLQSTLPVNLLKTSIDLQIPPLLKSITLDWLKFPVVVSDDEKKIIRYDPRHMAVWRALTIWSYTLLTNWDTWLHLCVLTVTVLKSSILYSEIIC